MGYRDSCLAVCLACLPFAPLNAQETNPEQLQECAPALPVATPGYEFLSARSELPEFANHQIGSIRLTRLPIFNEASVAENTALFRWANEAHFLTRESTINQLLLFSTDSAYDARALEESERLLRKEAYYLDVNIRPTRRCAGVIDIEVITKDTWSLTPSLTYDRSGGKNTYSASLRDTNLLGFGKTLSIAVGKDEDRRSRSISYVDNNLLQTRIRNRTEYIDSDDGSVRRFELALPFYALDTTRSWKLALENGQRIDAQFLRDTEVSEVLHDFENLSLEFGTSRGLQNGFSRRWRWGLAQRQHNFRVSPFLPPPDLFPEDRKLVYPYLGYESIEDNFTTAFNLNQMFRTEDLHLGSVLRWHMGYAHEALGSDQDRLVLEGEWRDTLHYSANALWQVSLDWEGYWNKPRAMEEDVLINLRTHYFRRWSDYQALYAAIEVAAARNLNTHRQLIHGALNGARAYPNRFQTGDRRWSFTMEHRVYTNLHLANLLHVGGAAFLDIGRAWQPGVDDGLADSQLVNIGFGLRLASSKAASSRIGHLDIAFPLSNRDDPAVDSVLLAFTVRSSF